MACFHKFLLNAAWALGQGEEVTTAMLDCVVAACAQMGDTGRMLETFEAYPTLGLKADAQAYNICMSAFIRNSLQDRLQFVRPCCRSTPGRLGQPTPYLYMGFPEKVSYPVHW